MIKLDLSTYRTILSSRGENLSQLRRNQSDKIIDATFTGDPTYRKVYILTSDGWKYEDVKYQRHTKASILKDAVDYYIQFRPKVHYPVGSYVIIPDDTDFNINLSEEELENPFSQPVNERTQWWIIVGRDNANAFVRYNILKCNWNFKWIYNNEIQECFGCVRNANSYTSGSWSADMSVSLDNITNAWLPDTWNVYGGENLPSLGLDDTRTIHYNLRFMITRNIIHPKCYIVSKVDDTIPFGIIKITMQQDDFDEHRDEPKLLLCNYYNDEGRIKVEEPEIDDSGKPSSIEWRFVNGDGEIVSTPPSDFDYKLHIGKVYYFECIISNNDSSQIDWRISLDGNPDLGDNAKEYYENLITLNKFNNNLLALRVGKAGSLKQKHFILSVSDTLGNYYSSIELEVV